MKQWRQNKFTKMLIIQWQLNNIELLCDETVLYHQVHLFIYLFIFVSLFNELFVMLQKKCSKLLYMMASYRVRFHVCVLCVSECFWAVLISSLWRRRGREMLRISYASSSNLLPRSHRYGISLFLFDPDSLL